MKLMEIVLSKTDQLEKDKQHISLYMGGMMWRLFSQNII